jgi:hypothetical protein
LEGSAYICILIRTYYRQNLRLPQNSLSSLQAPHPYTMPSTKTFRVCCALQSSVPTVTETNKELDAEKRTISPKRNTVYGSSLVLLTAGVSAILHACVLSRTIVDVRGLPHEREGSLAAPKRRAPRMFRNVAVTVAEGTEFCCT